MTHEEYVSRSTVLADAYAGEVLAHVASCAACASETRRADAALSRLEPRRRLFPEEVARWAAVAALLAVIAFGLRSVPVAPAVPEKTTARYRIVGDAAGVVAYTPGGIVVGIADRPAPKEVLR
jgi:hypothetical protein